ncbi:MAG: DUF2240 family protein [Methanomassiliicoccus sp.]|nr:DUF2240 family protein [Methanomassiliicoccus sp.]
MAPVAHQGKHMGELETSLGVLFKRKGKNVMTETEFILTVSFDYRWFTPKEAQMLLDVAVRRGLLTRTEEYLKPNFDIKDVEASLSFRPSKDVLSGDREEMSLFAQLIQLISEKGGLKKRDAVARVNRAQERLGVDVEVAAVVVAKDLGADVGPFLEPVRKEILAR